MNQLYRDTTNEEIEDFTLETEDFVTLETDLNN